MIQKTKRFQGIVKKLNENNSYLQGIFRFISMIQKFLTEI